MGKFLSSVERLKRSRDVSVSSVSIVNSRRRHCTKPRLNAFFCTCGFLQTSRTLAARARQRNVRLPLKSGAERQTGQLTNVTVDLGGIEQLHENLQAMDVREEYSIVVLKRRTTGLGPDTSLERINRPT